jgi:hypothetical protein
MPTVLYDHDGHRCLMFTDLTEEGGEAVQSNQFLVVDGDTGAVIDPGGNLAYSELYVGMTQHFPPSRLTALIASHADPDIIGSLDRWTTATQAKIYVSKVWERFVPHFCKPGKTTGRVVGIPDAGMHIRIGRHALIALPAHFMHSEGNFQFFDPPSGILFSGDLGVSIGSGTQGASGARPPLAPRRHALLAVALGVALAFSVHLINSSALAEFSSAVRAANGEPDLTLRGPREGFDERLFDAWPRPTPRWQLASPVLEIDTYARTADGRRVAAARARHRHCWSCAAGPACCRGPAPTARRPGLPGPARRPSSTRGARARWAGRRRTHGAAVRPGLAALRVAGSVPPAGRRLVVMDIAGAQSLRPARPADRIDLRLAPAPTARPCARAGPAGRRARCAPTTPSSACLNLSRAYRVNLTVLALVALFVGAFLVFSVVSLSVAQRTPAFALLGVLGLTARERRSMVLAECALLGAAGQRAGPGRWARAWRWRRCAGWPATWAAATFRASRRAAGSAPGPPVFAPWARPRRWPAAGCRRGRPSRWCRRRRSRAWARRAARRRRPGPGWLLLAAGVALAFAPPVAGLPLAAYGSVAALLLGGVALVPAAVHALLRLPVPRGALPLLALRRAGSSAAPPRRPWPAWWPAWRCRWRSR